VTKRDNRCAGAWRDYDRGVKREFSAGGVVVRRLHGDWHAAAIRPGGKANVWALPKGLVAPGEDPAATALREVAEETGVVGRVLGKLGDVRYVYTWDGRRIFKVVSFFLVRYSRGRLGDVPPELAHEVDAVRWVPLADAPRVLTYRGEKEMAERARAALAGASDDASNPGREGSIMRRPR
jgi:8-oxo-dGTP pyrophosphatase MutT (NUDIX family)